MSPKVYPSKANKEPTDLGVRGLADVKAALDKLKGPPVTSGHNIRPDDFSKLSSEQRAAISKLGRKVTNDRLFMVKSLMTLMLKTYLANKLLNNLFSRLLSPSQSRLLAVALIVTFYYNRWRAPPSLNKGEYKGPTSLPFFGVLLHMAKHKHELHDEILRMVRKANFETLDLPVPMSAFV